MPQVVIIDYGVGNLKSVQRGFEKVGAKVLITSDPDKIVSADRLILPGVGAFKDGMKGLKDSAVISPITDFVKTGRPFMGICLGMQMLLTESEEYGIHQGLGFISGKVRRIPSHDGNVFRRKIPHVGWSALQLPSSRDSWSKTLLSETNEGEYFYFVHSFMATPESNFDIIAECEYNGQKITAVVIKENIIGLQFHPEKSCGSGLRILKQFINN